MRPIRYTKTQDIVVLYTVQHLTMNEIGKLIGRSKAAISKRLKNWGIKSEDGEWVRLLCNFCGTEYRVRRGHWRRSEKHYCKAQCYYASQENPGYHPWRQGQRLAKAIISQYFILQEGNVVHHKDGDSRNNDRNNLAVYASQSDHLKATHHNNHNIKPIWDGSNP